MALTGSERANGFAAALASFSPLVRLKAWLADRGDDSRVQRLASAAFIIRVASAVLAFGSQILLARWMGSHEFGIFVYVWAWILLLGGVADLGIASAAQRFVPEYTERRSPELLRGFIGGSRWIVLGAASAVAAIGMLGVKLGGPWLDPHTLVPLYLACFALPLYALTHLQDAVARSYNWINLGLVPQFILRQVGLLALMAAALVAGFPMNATTAMVAFLLAVLLTTIGQSLVLMRRLAAKIEPGPRHYERKRWLAISLPILMVEGFYLLLTYTDVLILKQFRPAEEVAVYYAAAKTLALVAFIYFSISATTAHKFTEYHVAGDRARLEEFLASAIRWTFWPSLAATVLVLAFGRPLLALFGERFVEGYYLMFLLAIGLLARASIGPVERLLNMLGEQKICAAVYAAAFAINVALCVVLIPQLGVAGAAISLSTALIAESILLFVVTRRRLGFHVFVFGRKAGA